MRKYLLNSGVLGSIFSGWGLLQSTRGSKRDWRLLLLWLGWLSSVALSFGAVAQDAEKKRRIASGEIDPDADDQSKAAKKAEKKAAKARKVTLSI
ncbi:hypothetical protein [Paramicrobacterium agarici]|uniref:Uncharacterized protein n=1 Tax=Paramicrobacterium agarici TaxID=630514 RepID=A0A2A9DYZ1_9MICO|nr:hypothetical protein [Microbacterium agarici]PFG31586.1 hypothetical protein ATJ78_2559 [Microbacterium agarici]